MYIFIKYSVTLHCPGQRWVRWVDFGQSLFMNNVLVHTYFLNFPNSFLFVKEEVGFNNIMKLWCETGNVYQFIFLSVVEWCSTFMELLKKLILCSCSWAKSKCFVIKILDHSIFFILPMDCLYFPHGSSLFSSRIVFILPTDRLYFPMDRLYSPHR